MFVLALVSNGALWFFAEFVHPGGAPIILHFRAGSGADLLGGREALRTIPAVGLAVLALNAILSFRLRRRDRVVAGLLAVWALAVQFILGLALLALYFVNRSENF